MLRQSLEIYRQERKTFILGLKHYYGIDFYKLDKEERKEWLAAYIVSRREFLGNFVSWLENYPASLNYACKKENLR